MCDDEGVDDFAQSQKDGLIEILQLAYSGELAAARAYRGHWHSLRNPEERERIRKIEDEEWHHRQLVGEMLQELDSHPDPKREIRATWIGGALAFLCHLAGWFAPMYGAGKLESRNIREYETAARFAARCGCERYVDCLLTMAEVEWEHEHFFRSCVLRHRFSRWIKVWPQPPDKVTIRQSFSSEFPLCAGLGAAVSS